MSAYRTETHWLIATILMAISVDTVAESYSAKVLSVIAGDSLKIEHDGVQQFIALDGVECSRTTTTMGKKSRDFVRAQIWQSVVTIDVVEKKAGLTYARVHLPDGSVLNDVLLAQGLAKWNKYISPDNTDYRDLEDEAKDAGLGMWRSSSSPSDKPKAIDSATNEPVATRNSKEFVEHRQMVNLAKFELAYQLWSGFQEHERKLITSIALSILEGNMRSAQTLIEARSRIVEDLTSQRASIQDKIAVQNNAEYEALTDIYDDFDLEWDGSMLNSFLEDQSVEIAIGDRYGAKITGRLVAEYGEKTRRNLNRVNGQAQSAMNYYGVRRRNLLNADSSIAQAQSLQNSYLFLEQTNQTKRLIRDTGLLMKALQLEAALLAKYVPVLSISQVAVFNASGSDETAKFGVRIRYNTASFSVKTDLWGLTWKLIPDRGRGGLKAELRSVEEDSVISRFVSSEFPHNNIKVFEKSGEFYIDARATTKAHLEIKVFEIVVPEEK